MVSRKAQNLMFETMLRGNNWLVSPDRVLLDYCCELIRPSRLRFDIDENTTQQELLLPIKQSTLFETKAIKWNTLQELEALRSNIPFEANFLAIEIRERAPMQPADNHYFLSCMINFAVHSASNGEDVKVFLLRN